MAVKPLPRVILSILSCALLGIVGCGPPAFTSGIRDIADETLVELGAVNAIPVPGVIDDGFAESGGSSGPQSFEGLTGEYGVDDHPTVSVETNWTITFDYTPVIDECGSSEKTGYVDSNGAVFQATCFTDAGNIE